MIAPDSPQCEEYPIASSMEGAHGAAQVDGPGFQESAKQGGRIGGMVNAYQRLNNESFRAVI